MKNIKLTLLGTAALLIAVGLNIRHALNDYGVRDNKLHVEVLAQSNGSGGGGSNSGGGTNNDNPRMPEAKTGIEIHLTGTLSHYQSSTNNQGGDWSVNGSGGAEWGPININLGANFGKTSNGTMGNWSYGSASIDITISGQRIDCQGGEPQSCFPFDPIYVALQAYRPFIQ
jgi:hypothetical protein